MKNRIIGSHRIFTLTKNMPTNNLPEHTMYIEMH